MSVYYKGPNAEIVNNGQTTPQTPKSKKGKSKKSLAYERTLMVGRYRDELRQHARQISNRPALRINSVQTKKRQLCPYICADGISLKQRIKRFFGEDYFFLAMLGVIMSFFSFIMDFCIEKIQEIHLWLYEEAKDVGPFVGYLAWVGYTLVLVLFSTGFVQTLAPQAIGSGIPEMKTILRGVVLKEYLTLRTLICKMVGLTVSLGSGLPIGKEGPFVHVASVVASVMSKLVTGEDGIFANESRSTEMLAAACAVGVACTFGAPVGGVLFSIEVTSVYFAVRNYWRGFFAAACSATVFRLLAVWFKGEVTVVAFYRTSFPSSAFLPEELIPFALIGVVCGCGGALFIYTHRSIVLFIRNNTFVKRMLKKNRFLYPGLMALFISTMMFPLGYGQFVAGELNFRSAIQHFFSNFSWNSPDLNVVQADMVRHWTISTNLYVTLTLYCLNIFFMSAIANTMPIPAGVFIPVFVIGASFGRLCGECMFEWFPQGLRGASGGPIYPGGYAVVGAAAFCGSVTHTVSVSVIVFELTGQLVYLLPVMIAVLVSNAVCSYLQPSIYDSIIQIKHLPYIPDILPTSSSVHRIFVEDIMVREVKYLSKDSTFKDVQDILIDMPRLKAFPLVDRADSMVLLGSIPRAKLVHLLDEKVGWKIRKQVAFDRHQMIYGRCESDEGAPKSMDLTDAIDSSGNAPRFKVTKVDESKRDQPQTSLAPRLSIPEQWKSNTSHDRTDAIFNKRPSVPHLSIDTGMAGVHNAQRKSSYQQVSPSNAHFDVSKKMSLGFSGDRRRNASGDSSDRMNNVSASHSTWHHQLSTTFRTFTSRFKYFRNRPDASSNPEDYDLPDDERKSWEAERLRHKLDLNTVHVDPAPFQLVERTSLYKVHSLFSLLGLNRAYVTALGKLIGVVALKELRAALESAQNTFSQTEDSVSRLSNVDDGLLSTGNEASDENTDKEQTVVLDDDRWHVDDTCATGYSTDHETMPIPDIKVDSLSSDSSDDTQQEDTC